MKRKFCATVVTLTGAFAFAENAQACEPILPFMKVVGGPAMFMGSWVALASVVVIKSIIFSFSQKKLNFGRAFAFMIAGNVLTTLIGVIVAVMMGSGGLTLLGALIVWPLCVPPARRVLATSDQKWLKRLSAGSLAFLMTLAFIASCILFALSYFNEDETHLAVHWVLKLGAVYIALIASLVLTAFWEEWVVWKLSCCAVEYTGYVQPVIRANLIVLLCVMLYAAAVMLPQRLKSPHFLAQLYRQTVPLASPTGDTYGRLDSAWYNCPHDS
ncbi:MAG TPA: hypothetical protein VG754_14050 [Verrucomicrobiae bacterium]|nr:hypothetical protein [Verrucomicrobiae bacterium]